LPYIRFLDTALERLPEAFIFRGRVHRGVRSPPRRARTHPRLIQYTRNRPPPSSHPPNDGVPPQRTKDPRDHASDPASHSGCAARAGPMGLPEPGPPRP
jgi:hypothetical protein